MTVKHTYATEVLYHFNCGACTKWWSISGHKEPPVSKHLVCPHCGTTAEFEEKKRP